LGYSEQRIIAYDNNTAEHFRTDPSFASVRFELFPLPELTGADFTGLRLGPKRRRIREAMFALRWRYILHQLQQGYSIVLTDVDNIFNRYVPLTDFQTHDVIHAYETYYPLDVFEARGFVVCGGMTWFHANPRTIDFVQRVVNKCGKYCDDQIIVNQMILNDLQIQWDSTDHLPPPELRKNHSTVNEKEMTGTSVATGHSVKIWPRHFAYREFMPTKPSECPPNNWVAMPNNAVVPEGFVLTRQTAHRVKIRMQEQWDSFCGSPTQGSAIIIQAQ